MPRPAWAAEFKGRAAAPGPTASRGARLMPSASEGSESVLPAPVPVAAVPVVLAGSDTLFKSRLAP